MRNIIICLTLLMFSTTCVYATGEEPAIYGNWKLVKVYGGNGLINNHDIGKVVLFSKEGKCRSYMENFPKESEFKLKKGYSYATGRKAWMVSFSNTMASDYEIYTAKDTLYLLCSCSEGRHFVFVPTKEKLAPMKTDTLKKKTLTAKAVPVINKKPDTKPSSTPVKKKIAPTHKPVQPAHVKKEVPKSKPHHLPVKKVKADTTGN